MYHQLRWDPRLAGRPFLLHVEDRAVGFKEIPFRSFVPGGEIPWHRVARVSLDGRTLWCRTERIDRLDELATSTPAPPGADPEPLPPASPAALRPLTPREPRKHPPSTPGLLRVATLNVLNDAFQPELLATERRFPVLARFLGSLDADLLGLSEVTPALHRLLLAQGWVDFYHVSDREGASVRPHGQLLLSRWPLRSAAVLPLTATRRVLCCDVQAPGGLLRVLVVHLVSNATPGAEQQRRAELARVIELLEGHPRALVLGDFNLDEGEAQELLDGAQLRDLWRASFPQDPGFTYDPVGNPLAALFSRDGVPRRYDRVLLRGPGELGGASLFADGPRADEQGLFLSDHAGVQLDLRLQPAGSLDSAEATYHTALALVPPRSCWEAIEALRSEHDRGVLRWPPHVTLIYGFAPPALFPEALARAAEVCRGFASFPVQLAAAGRFDHGGSSTVWLEPRSDQALVRLQQALQRAFPRFSEQGDRGFTPHLTVARFPKAERARAVELEQRLRSTFSPISFEATELHLLVRRGDQPFEAAARVPLGPGAPRPGLRLRDGIDPWTAPDERPLDPAPVIERVRGILEHLAAERGLPAPWVEPFGAAAYCEELPYSDLDLFALCPRGLPAGEALGELQRRLAGEGVAGRWVTEALQPAVRVVLGGVAVDIVAAELRRDGAPGPSSLQAAGALGELPEPERVAAQGALDGAALREATRALGGRWPWLLSAVRRWSVARAVRGAWAGYPSGIGWALLVARYILDHPDQEGSELLRGFFGWCAGRPWPSPVALGDEVPGVEGVMPVLTPTAPVRDAARTVTASSLQVLRGELRRAASAVEAVQRGQAPARELFEEARPPGEALQIKVEGNDEERAAGRGHVQRSLLAEVRRLEEQGGPVRVYARWEPVRGADVLSLGREVPDRERPGRGRRR
jgi:poly(A) polymerase